MTYKITNYHVATDILPHPDNNEPSRLVFATRTGKSMRLTDLLYQRLLNGAYEGLPDKTLLRLFELELMVPADQDEFLTVLTRNRTMVASPTNLSIVIQPTASCQLGCSYCGQSHSRKKTTDAISELVLSQIAEKLQRRRYRTLSMEWFGAEPLMAYSRILQMSDRIIDICQTNDVAYTAHMITNGLILKPNIAKSLLSRKCTNFQVTLDGTAGTHNNLRAMKDGRPTFDIILDNVTAVCMDNDFHDGGGRVIIRINVNRTSGGEVPGLIDLLHERGLHRRGVAIDLQPVIDWGGNGAAENSYAANEYAQLEIDWILHAIERGFASADVLPRRRTQPCMVVEPDGAVYDADGDIYPCYEFPYTEAFEGPEYRIGNVANLDRAVNETPVTRTWFNDVETDVAPCKRCSLFPVCGGGCPKKWLHGEVACPSFKQNIKDRILLDYLSRRGLIGSSKPQSKAVTEYIPVSVVA